MLVKMRTQYAGPNGTCSPDKVIDLDQAEAQELVKGGYAVPFDPNNPDAETSAASTAGAETATATRQARRV